MSNRPGPRSFDPVLVGRLECRAWVAYYRHEWFKLLRAAIRLTRHTFALPWSSTLHGAWLVMRANQLWAPADNDPAAARRTMTRFYALLKRHHGERFDPRVAADLEVEWWRVHREHQSALDDRLPVVDALVTLYAYVYDVEPDAVRPAAQQRALAMSLSDRWVTEGRDPGSSLVGEERAALVRSHAALLSAVHRA
ncbi:MAG: hypothetical protein ACR2NR_20865 [Solirubrobacteraceae bacterium]